MGGTLFQIGSYLKFLESLNLHNRIFVPNIGALLEEQPESLSRSVLNDAEDDKFIWMGTRPQTDLGYLASTIQLVAATIFWAGTVTCLPGVTLGFLSTPLNLSSEISDAIFWTSEVVGACGFLISATLYMLELQTTWWKPKLTNLGW